MHRQRLIRPRRTLPERLLKQATVLEVQASAQSLAAGQPDVLPIAY